MESESEELLVDLDMRFSQEEMVEVREERSVERGDDVSL